jgi:hypothetical protein
MVFGGVLSLTKRMGFEDAPKKCKRDVRNQMKRGCRRAEQAEEQEEEEG